MLFWTRAFLCIGAATALAVGRLPATPARAPAPALAGSAAALAGEACRIRPDLCAAAAMGGLRALTPPPEPRPARSRLPRRAARPEDPVALGRRSLT